jgi:hypothetical protein
MKEGRKNMKKCYEGRKGEREGKREESKEGRGNK